MSNDLNTLHRELQNVARRRRRLWLLGGLSAVWLLMALVGVAVLEWARQTNHAVPGIALILLIAVPVLAIPVLLSSLRRISNARLIARRIEKRHPDLDARLLAALEQKPDEKTRQLGFLQQTVIDQSIEHARKHQWETVVSTPKLRLVQWIQWCTLATAAIVLGLMLLDMSQHRSRGGWLMGGISDRDGFAVSIEPGDASIERGSPLLVLARFTGRLPGEVQFVSRDADGKTQQLAMSKSLNDPVFATRLPSVSRDLTYFVRYDDAGQTRDFKVNVFDYPELRQADAKLTFPKYTNQPETTVQDVRSITAVEGTKATLLFHLNKPVTQATLVPREAGQPVALVKDAKDPTLYSLSMDMARSQRFRLQLRDADGRQNKEPAAELAINVNPNQPPQLKPVWPARDVDVSPIQELSVSAKAWDDFGIHRAGLTYSLAGQAPQELVLASDVPANQQRDVTDLVSMEKLGAQPDQLLSYYFWAEDFAPDGSIRRTSGDMYFAEVRPFEAIFRQGQQPSQSQQEQSAQQNQNSQNGQQAEQLAEQQKQVIAATWKVMRRETAAQPSPQFVPDVNLIHDSQTALHEQAAGLGQNLTDERSAAHLGNVLKFMDQAANSLSNAAGGPSAAPLSSALSAEQSAYQELLRLRAREFEVVRGNQQNRNQQRSSSAASRRQQQLNQLQLSNEQNRYETQRTANAPQENPQQRETRQVLSRLRELAQRQDDLNRQMRELQSALQQAQDPQQREDLQRQLARLRDQQQQQLRDTDELRDRMDQPENQQRMADSRQQLEQTRENVRRASESLQQGLVPQAASAGARASEQLNNLRDQFRRNAAGQFTDAMNQMRDQARQLDENQKQLSQRLSQLDQGAQQDQQEQHSLRSGSGDPQDQREQIAQDLGKQKQQLDQLLDQMRKTIDDAETSEPLLSKQLYDTLRQTTQQKTDEALDVSQRLVQHGLTNEARQAESQAGEGISKLHEGIEQAARSVVGDETEALRRARDELNQLSRELQQEVDRNRPTTQPQSDRGAVAQRGGPTTREGQFAARGGPTTRQFASAESPTTRPGGSRQARAGNQQRDGNQQSASNQQRTGQQGQQQRSGQVTRQGGQTPDAQQGQDAEQGQDARQAQNQSGQGGSEQANAQSQRQRPNGARQAGGGLRGNPQQQDQQANSDQQQPDQPTDATGQPQSDQPGQQQGQRRGQPLRNGVANNFDPNNRRGADNPETYNAGGSGPGGNRIGPIAGDDFLNWSDRLRDVEEMVNDPRLRAQAARIRQRAREMRAESRRHTTPPNWDLVDKLVARPLMELRDQVSEELLRHDASREALVPIDREPVPPAYSQQVREYYERLGSGRQ